jgi:MoaA/NifB/PqqE/SkfB family radical SAM enzyme
LWRSIYQSDDHVRAEGIISISLLDLNLLNLASNALTRSAPLYVQYYVTARCNLRCEQCNVIYANADRRELQTEEAFKVIENLATVGTSVVLLTGGEPFVRKDLPKLAGKLIEHGCHPRIQTNGLATPDRLRECADFGVNDISISLDSLLPDTQDMLNGGFENSWATAINTISNVSTYLGTNTFGAFGCVFSPYNFRKVTDVIKFATEIGWWVSLVPAHTTDPIHPRAFSTFNSNMQFHPNQYTEACEILDQILEMKKQGYHVYDSDQFIEDMKHFIKNEPLTWRDRNGGVCDSGSLYFAVMPDGSMAPCCDWRMESLVSVVANDFPRRFSRGDYQNEINGLAKSCSGCLYGSYPEITISARYFRAAIERVKLFKVEAESQIERKSPGELTSIAKRISGSNATG